jgi:3-oxoacyl-[acyl-carrier-protein] synthase II
VSKVRGGRGKKEKGFMKTRVVLTGLGPITPIGIGKDEYWDALVRGRSGARKISFDGYDMEQYASKIACPIEHFSLSDHVHRSRDLKYYGRTSQFAVAGTKLALEDAGLDVAFNEKRKGQGDYRITGIDSEMMGIIMGVGTQNMDLCEKYHEKLLKSNGPKRIIPLALPQIQICAVPSNISKKFTVRGTTYSISAACASANLAVIEAYKQILLGEEKIMITGGTDACITPYVFGGFTALHGMSVRNDEPERASRPFDKDRDGFVLGEGAGIVVVEELKHAKQRGARIYCELTGYGCTSDAYHIVAPEPSGDMQARAITKALKNANLRPEAVDYINAHGASTAAGDLAETQAIKKTFGKRAYHIPISSTKSMAGHLIGGSGGIEIIATAMMIQSGTIHPTVNLEKPGEGCDLNYVPGTVVKKTIRRAIKNSFAFGGQNASIVLERYDP